MPLVSVLDGTGLASSVSRIMRQAVLVYPDQVARDLELRDPWPGATTLLLAGMRLEAWDGARWWPLGGNVLPPVRLDDLLDVALANPIPGHVLRVTSGSGAGAVWSNVLLLLGMLGDVTVPAPVDGQVLTYSAGYWRAAAPGTPTITSPLIIPDPTGSTFPILRFASGDGDSVTASSAAMELAWWANTLQWLHGGALKMDLTAAGAAGVGSLGVSGNGGAWYLNAGAHNNGGDKNLYLVNGNRTTGTAPLIIGQANNLVYAPYALDTPRVQNGSGVLVLAPNAGNHVEIQGNSPPTCWLDVGAQYGIGAGPKISANGRPAGNDWTQRPFSVSKDGGAGECAIGLGNFSTGNSMGIQLFTGANGVGVHFTNGPNSGYVPVYGGVYANVSGRDTKDDIQDLALEVPDPLGVLARLRPRRFRPKAAPKMGPGPLEYVDDTDNVPKLAGGFVAEEVAEAYPLAVVDTDKGPALDYSSITALLVRAVQSLALEVADLRAQLTGGAPA